MMTLILRRRVLAKVGFERPVVEFVIKPMVDMLESLHPANREAGPWLEYPWLTPEGNVATPCEELPDLEIYGARSNRAALLLRFAKHLVTNHDKIFS